MFSKWIGNTPDWREWTSAPATSPTFNVYTEFSVSHCLILSDSYIVNSWWLAIMQVVGSDIYQWINILDNQSLILTMMLLKSADIWFGSALRKPPDKREKIDYKQKIDYIEMIYDSTAYLVYLIEDFMFYCFKVEIDLCSWFIIGTKILADYVFEILGIFLAIDFSEQQLSDQEWNHQIEKEIPLINVNAEDPYRFIRSKTVYSNLVFSMSTKSNRSELDSAMQLDSDSYFIAIDTCTSETIVRHKELFVGKIKPCRNLFVQGVGGNLKASGYGTIKIRVTCDEGYKHDLLIHNVIYLPESPVNLLSPQKWSQGSTNMEGTGEITVGNATLLFWNNRESSKLIPHHPELGIPIMTVNDGYTKSSAFFNLAQTSMFCQPCIEDNVAFRTSQTIIDPTSKLEHTIPIDDDEELFDPLEGPSQFNNIQIDELDKMIAKKRQYLENEKEIINNRLDNLNDAESVSLATDDDDQSTLGDDTFQQTWAEDEEWEHNEDDPEVVPVPQNEIDKIVTSISEKTSDLQRELLGYHFRLKHLPFSALKRLAEKNIIPRRLAKVPAPMCYPCQMGKQHKKPWRGKGRKHKKHIRRERDNFPGANTSTDQMISQFGGLIPQMKGRLMKAKYYAATIYVDHHTDFTYVHLMKDTTAASTLESKNAYEHLLQTYGHKVLAYHADNGRFAEKVFMGDVKDKAQNLTFCGVGSHHQNGIAERKIRTLGEDARTMLAHGQHLWPEVVSKSLWPFAYKAACRARNRFKLDDQMLSPEEKLTGLKVNQDIKNEHPLFCPVFVLNSRLQGGIGGLPKWNPRANACVYLGHSPDHASNVALVLNLATGLVSPQYHVVFDDDFSTVDFIKSKKQPSNWENLCRYHTEDYRMEALPGVQTLDDLQLDLIPTPQQPDAPSVEQSASHQQSDASASDPSNRPSETSTSEESSTPNLRSSIQSGDDQSATNRQEGDIRSDSNTFDFNIPSDSMDSGNTSSTPSEVSEGATLDQMSQEHQEEVPAPETGARRSSRVRKPVERLTSSKLGELTSTTLLAALSFITSYLSEVTRTPENHYVAFKANLQQKIVSHQAKLLHYDEAVQLNVDGSSNYMHPLAFAAKNSGNDTFYFHQAMQQDDREDFIQAMIKELEDHKINRHWKLVERSKIGDAPTIKAIWSFKRKRRPDGSLLKHKARLCAHGGMQIHGENFWDTYAPVVQWVSIRMMLTLSVIHDLYTTSIDFTLAFPQAETDVTIYMEIPIGCSVPEGDYVCLLLKNLYGLKQAAKTWFEYLRDALILSEDKGGYGFKQSLIDPCVFYKEGITLISWVDDCLIFTREKDLADNLISTLKESFTLSEEDDVSAYLGVKMKIDKENNTVSMTQPFLIDRIVDLLGDAVKDANVKPTPSVYKEILHRDEDGPDRKQQWNYRSAIGMLNYLAASTRPDCLFAVHQCARFSTNPKLSHERAVKRIVRYLKGTRDKGLIIKPDETKGVQCFVDADFAGGYSAETSEDPVSVFSRTGYVIFYLNCPVIWVSKMQSEISLSTTEAEYIALSQSMRDLIPFLDYIKEMDKIFDQATEVPQVHCALFEDNNGALELAKAPRYRPRTKHIAIKYHHFRGHVKSGRIKIQPIETREQIADQFTKGLSTELFEYLRFKLLGW